MGNGCLNRKGYKMRCLQIHFTNGIKRIRDKTFCFDVWLGPNPCTWHIARIHGVGCKFAESRGIRMFEFAPLLLWKWAMTSSLSQNSFYQLQAKCEWLTILESLKKKNKQGQRPQPSTKQTRCFYELKKIYTCGVHLRLLLQTSLVGLRLWVILVFSVSISTCSGEALASRWPWSLPPSLSLLVCLHIQFPWDMCINFGLHRVCACIFNSRRICAQIMYFLFWLVWNLCLHIQFPEDMCTSSWCSNFQRSPWWNIHLGEWLAKECISDPWGSLLGNVDLWGSLWFVTY